MPPPPFIFSRAGGGNPPKNLSYTMGQTVLTDTSVSPVSPLVSGGSVSSYTLVGGSLGGLVLDPSTGVLSGRVTSPGNITAQIAANNSDGSSFFILTFVAYLRLSGLSYSNAGQSYSVNQPVTPLTPSLTGSPDSYAVVVNSLPAGLTLDPSSGIIIGTPTTEQNLTWRVRASNPGSTTDISLSANIAADLLTLGTLTYSDLSQVYAIGQSFTNLVPSISGPVSTWSVTGSLPSGWSLNGANGVLSGTNPATVGTFNFSIVASNARFASSVNLSITTSDPNVLTGPLTYTNISQSFNQGSAITTMSPSSIGNVTNYSVISGSLPAGLAISASTGNITGSPTSSGSSSFVVRASNSAYSLDSSSITIVVTAALQARFVKVTGTTAGYVVINELQIYDMSGSIYDASRASVTASSSVNNQWEPINTINNSWGPGNTGYNRPPDSGWISGPSGVNWLLVDLGGMRDISAIHLWAYGALAANDDWAPGNANGRPFYVELLDASSNVLKTSQTISAWTGLNGQPHFARLNFGQPVINGFNPMSLNGLKLWFDAADVSAVPSGSTWKDKAADVSGSVIGTPVVSPFLMNGRRCIIFNDVSSSIYRMSPTILDNVWGPPVSTFTAFMVAMLPQDGINNSWGTWLSIGRSGLPDETDTNLFIHPIVNNGASNSTIRALYSGSESTTVISHPSRPVIIEAQQTPTQIRIRNLNGGTNDTSYNTFNSSLNMSGNADRIAIAARSGQGGFGVGNGFRVGEVLVYNNIIPSTIERQNIINYLRVKWGL